MKGLGFLKRITLILMVLFVYPSFGADVLPAPATCDNETLKSDGDPVSLRAEWTANTFTLKYYDGDEQLDNIVDPEMTQCTYNEKIAALPDGPEKPGYAFRGWRVRHKCTLRDSWDDDMADERIDWDSEHVRWKPISNNGYTMANYGWTENSSDLPAGGWAVLFSTGEIKGRALCSTTPGEWATVGTPVETGGGQYCWCAGTSFGDSCSVSSPAWVFNFDGNADVCAANCARNCASFVNGNSAFRRAVFGVTQ